MDDFANYKVADLKRELKSRGLNTNGAKPELLLRLQTAIATEKSGLEDSSVMDDSLIDEDSMLEEDDESGSDVDSSNENSTDSPVNLSSPVKTPEKKDLGSNIAPVTSPNVQNKAAENTQNGDQSGIPTKKKKITINRLPVQSTQPAASEVSLPPPEAVPVAEADPSPASDNLVAGKVVKLSATAVAVDKIKSRQEKFGSISNVTSAAVVVAAAPVAEKLKKRADRFGSAGSTGSGTGAIAKVSATPEDQLKLAKRKERFGIQLAEEKNAEISAAKEKRNARFGGGVATVSTPEIEERKLKRAARFASAT